MGQMRGKTSFILAFAFIDACVAEITHFTFKQQAQWMRENGITLYKLIKIYADD